MRVNNQPFFVLFFLLFSTLASLQLMAQDCSNWTQLASEGGSFQLSGTKTVRYGANGRYVYKTLSGNQACTNGNFGSDPIRGVVKQCHVCTTLATEGDSHTFSKEKAPENIKSVVTETTSEGDYICSTGKVNAVKSFNTNFVLESSGLEGIVYPGALVYGEDVLNGNYRTINVPRKPLMISTTASFVNGNPAINLHNPNRLSSVRTDINSLMINQNRGQVQAETSYEQTEMYNEKQLEIAFSGRFSRNGFSIYGAFDMAQSSKKKVVVAKFLQKYYTIDTDAPARPSDFFQHQNDYHRINSNAKTPLYVSQVVYGRAAYFYLETEENSLEMEAALKAAYESVMMEGEVSASTKVNELLSKSTIKVIVIGGSGTASSQVINGYEGFKRAVIEGSVFDPSSLARPIAYTLKFLDNEIANMNATTSYTKRECVKNTNTFRVTIDRIVLRKMSGAEPGNHNEVGGNVQIKAMAKGAMTTFEEQGVISPEGAFEPTYGDFWGTRMIIHPQPGTAHFNNAKFYAGVARYDIRSSSGGNVLLQENPDGNLTGDYINVKFKKVYKVKDHYTNVRFQIKVRIREDDARDTILEEEVWVDMADTNQKNQYIELRDKDIYRVYYSIDTI